MVKRTPPRSVFLLPRLFTDTVNVGLRGWGTRGIWASEFVKPWEWRRGKRLAANDNAPDQCHIKGNINRKGERIYHMPGQQATV